ncbi:FG-GAP-like repeat-containing protein [Hahella sp. CR1]|uniref:G8 domain-containing protein n=1 Tax=Hahella sp. CR1 TaxID=2992807 RepID=UPI002442CFA9|nr:G8 domain-containing protein [Hahella sp. CR1]MDG9669446.1 FG-GAP-like repeat-containing protein [Hahella sp. CR1]
MNLGDTNNHTDEPTRGSVLKRKGALSILTTVAALTFCQSAMAVTAVGEGVVTPIGDSGFETPDVPSGGYQYLPKGGEWAFADSAGITENGSAFTSCNPATPQGQQALFIQQTGQVQKTITIPSAGAYRVNLRGAQRGCINSSQGQTLRVSLAGSQVGRIRPQDTNYRLYHSTAMWLEPGKYQLLLSGLSASGDNTAFVDDVQLEKLPMWSEASSWLENSVPGPGEEVYIPAGSTMVLDNLNAASVIINEGILTAPVNRDFTLDVAEIHVMAGGLLELGREEAPFNGQGVITLLGDNPAAESKLIHAMNGGRIEMHGQPQRSWTQLGASAAIGDNSITLKETVNWRAGDRIVIASSDFDMNHAEEFTIVSLSGDRKTLTLNDRLAYNHFGKLQQYSDNGQSWTLDERAEVGLLSRNLRIQGDEDSGRIAYGGNIMVMRGAFGRLSNVELTRMGQRRKLGRYPFHWHLAGNAAGQYIRNSSIHHTYNRAITVHGTNNASVENNVCYDNLGHALFMEDGNETGNRIVGNLGMVTRKPAPEYALLPSDFTNGRLRNASGPSTFWITNPNNIVQNNHAAGSDGSGFWFAFHQNPNSPVFVPGLNPNVQNLPAGAIDNNTAHSSFHGWLLGMAPTPNDASQTPNLNNDYMPQQEPVINGLTVYKNYLGMYSRVGGNRGKSTYNDLIVADNYEGEASTWVTDYNRVLWVGASENYEPVAPLGLSASSGVIGLAIGHILYDGPVRIRDSHFTGFERDNFTLFDQWGANIKYSGHSLHNTTVSPGSYQVRYRNDYIGPVWFNGAIYDVDGTFTGQPMTAITQDHPMLVDGNSSRIKDGLSGMESRRRFAYVEVRPSDEIWLPPAPLVSRRRQDSTFFRSDGARYTESRKEIEGVSLLPMVDGAYNYAYIYHDQIPSITRFDYHSMSSGEYVTLELPGVAPNVYVYLGTPAGQYGFSGPLIQLGSVGARAALRAFDGNAWAYENGSLFVRFKAPAGADFRNPGELGSIFVCLNPGCAPGANRPLAPNVYVLNKQGGARTTFQKLLRSKSFISTAAQNSALEAANEAWQFDMTDWDRDGYMDIAGFKKRNTGTGTTEVHIMDGKSGLQRFIFQSGTALGYINVNDHMAIRDYNGDGQPDIWAILHNTTGSGRTEVHVLDGRNPQNFLLHDATGLGLRPNSSDEFLISDYDRDGRPDLWYIAKRGGSNRTEVHILSAQSGYDNFVVHSATALHATDDNWSFRVADFNGDGAPDLIGFKRNGVNSTEIHVLNGANNFQNFLFQSATELPKGSADNVYLISDR